MSKRYIFYFFGLASLLHAQLGVPGSKTLHGEVSQEGVSRFEHLYAELTSQGRPVEKTVVMPDGGFEFRFVPEGVYEVRITTPYGEVLRSEMVSLQQQAVWVTLKIPQLRKDRPIAGTVSVSRLRKPVPSKARKEYDRGRKALDKGDVEGCILRFQHAVEIFPDYMEAHNDLGVRYMNLGHYQRSAEEFRNALILEPDAVLPNANLALSLIASGAAAEAEAPARRALAGDPNFLGARYALGLIALSRGQCTKEAAENLRAAAQKYPRARLSAAKVLACRGERELAAAELETYLSSGGAENRSAVEAWMRSLR